MLRTEQSGYGEVLRAGGAVTAIASVVAGLLVLLLMPPGRLSGLGLVFSASAFVMGAVICSLGQVMLHSKRGRIGRS